MTIVPVRSLITTFAGESVSTIRFSISAIRRARSAVRGFCTITSWLSRASAIGAPKAARAKALTVSAMRIEVVKSGLRNCRTRLTESLNLDGSSRSIIAPFGTRPEVVMPSWRLAAWPWALKPETMTEPCATA